MSAVEPLNRPPSPSTPLTPVLSQCSTLCNLTIPQLLQHSALTHTTHVRIGNDEPRPVLYCNACGGAVAAHRQSVSGDDGGLSNGNGIGGGKYLTDPIHGHIFMSADLLAIIDTPHFQRLRDLKQLGSAYWVFPGASHNRFEHSIGVSHLAGVLTSHLARIQPELNISARDVFLVKVAALCHDLGHGPFSHIFDNEFVPAAQRHGGHVPARPWKHEEMSVRMLEALLPTITMSAPLTSAELAFIRSCIDPSTFVPSPSHPRPFLYDIVSNARNSLDVDKFDYISRDCYALGLSRAFSYERLIVNSRVINNEICFNAKATMNIYEMFHQRYLLHKNVYQHRVGKSIEYMITDILLLADKRLRISKAIEDVNAYLKLTDCILKQIEVSEDADEDMIQARALVLRLRRRNIYSLVDELIIPSETGNTFPQTVTAEHILAFNTHHSLLEPNDLHIQNVKLNYAMRDGINPVDHIKFFDKNDLTRSYTIPAHKVTQLIPERFEERILRVFLKPANADKFAAAQFALTEFLKQNGQLSPGPIQRTGSGNLMPRTAAAVAAYQSPMRRPPSSITPLSSVRETSNDGADDIKKRSRPDRVDDVRNGISGGAKRLVALQTMSPPALPRAHPHSHHHTAPYLAAHFPTPTLLTHNHALSISPPPQHLLEEMTHARKRSRSGNHTEHTIQHALSPISASSPSSSHSSALESPKPQPTAETDT